MTSSYLSTLAKIAFPVGHTSMNLNKVNFWHPHNADALLGSRHKTAIFHPSSALKHLLRAFYVFSLVLQSGGHVLIVNTNPEYTHVIRSTFAGLPNISYCSSKWIGGTLTNWKQISKSILTFATFSKQCDGFLQKNHLHFPRYKRVQMHFEGFLANTPDHDTRPLADSTLLAFVKKPDVIFLINPNENRNLIREASKLHIPIIGFIGSNTNTHGITYPIPYNISSFPQVYTALKRIVKIARDLQPRVTRK